MGLKQKVKCLLGYHDSEKIVHKEKDGFEDVEFICKFCGKSDVELNYMFSSGRLISLKIEGEERRLRQIIREELENYFKEEKE